MAQKRVQENQKFHVFGALPRAETDYVKEAGAKIDAP